MVVVCYIRYRIYSMNIIHEAYNLRMQCCNFISTNGDYFIDFIESSSISDYVNNLRKSATYGDNIEIFCLAQLYSVNIWVYEEENM